MNWESIIDLISKVDPMIWAVIALVLFVLLLLSFLVRKLKPKSVVAYTTDSGRVLVSQSAIVELVQTSCAQVEAIAKPSVKIRTQRNKTHLQIGFKLTSGGRMREIEQLLKSHLTRTLTENLGIENLGTIEIKATGFKGGKIQSPVAHKPKQLEEFTDMSDINPDEVEEEESKP
ncbi:hypothetical protein [Coraliomargarita parva]|uniref:hypothetical protein n=1 Tax=Coraliomargarita parva TaxID=3014050 RepID=UPI0022B47319|nr:hypothetical protein [Coraliomargarita parva]